jgi:hypothetical protein
MIASLDRAVPDDGAQTAATLRHQMTAVKTVVRFRS